MKQPPVETIKNRLLRPSPVVMVDKKRKDGDKDAMQTGEKEREDSGLFVEVGLVGAVSNEDFSSEIEGEKVERVGHLAMVSFKKLKIRSSSSKRGQAFKLRFVLKQYLYY